MAMLDAIYAATINPNLKKNDRHKPREASTWLPYDYYREPEQKTEQEHYDMFRNFVRATTR